MRSRIIRLASATLVLLSCMSSAVIHTTPATHPDAVRYASAAYMRLPLSFEANNGQTDPRVKFLTRGSGYQLFLTPTEAVLTLRQDVGGERTHKKSHHDSSEKADASSRSAVLRMKIVGGNAEPGLTGLGELTGRTNYFIGNDPEKWRTNVPNYARVEYHSVYPGVDLVYYGSQGRVEHDFVVAPGADPSQIKLSFDGANKVGIDDQGDLVLGVPGGELRLERPRIYQDIKGERREIAGGYVLTGPAIFAAKTVRLPSPLITSVSKWLDTIRPDHSSLTLCSGIQPTWEGGAPRLVRMLPWMRVATSMSWVKPIRLIFPQRRHSSRSCVRSMCL